MFVFGWLAIIYITFKPYPMTYINGVLLVDPQKMMNDGYGDTALLIAFPVARFCEKKWVRFRRPACFKGILTGIIGLVPMWLMTDFMKAPLDQALEATGDTSCSISSWSCIPSYCFPSMCACYGENPSPVQICNPPGRTRMFLSNVLRCFCTVY